MSFQGAVGDRWAVSFSAWRSKMRLDFWGMNMRQLVGSVSRNIYEKEKVMGKGTKGWVNLKLWEDGDQFLMAHPGSAVMVGTKNDMEGLLCHEEGWYFTPSSMWSSAGSPWCIRNSDRGQVKTVEFTRKKKTTYDGMRNSL